MTLIDDVKRKQAGPDPRIPWLSFVREVGSGRITDVDRIAAELPTFGKTPDELDSALQRFETLTYRLNLARQLPALEAKVSEEQRRAQATAADIEERRQQIRELERHIETLTKDQLNARMMAGMIGAEVSQSREALERLQDRENIPQLPDELREPVGALADLKRQLDQSALALETLETDRNRQRQNSDAWATANNKHASAAGHHARLEQDLAAAHKRVLEILGS